jgi:hypothetical protein
MFFEKAMPIPFRAAFYRAHHVPLPHLLVFSRPRILLTVIALRGFSPQNPLRQPAAAAGNRDCGKTLDKELVLRALFPSAGATELDNTPHNSASHLIRLASKFIFCRHWSKPDPLTKPGPTPSSLSSLARHRPHFLLVCKTEPPQATMGTDGSAGAGAGALDPHDCEAAHYVVTNHRPGSVHLTARCSFLGPDTQVRSIDTIGHGGRIASAFWRQTCGEGTSSILARYRA